MWGILWGYLLKIDPETDFPCLVESRNCGLLGQSPNMAVTSQHGTRDVSRQRHDCLLRDGWILRQPRYERVPPVMPAVAYLGSRAGAFPGFLPFTHWPMDQRC
jgi:hypothetical protein